MPTAHFTPELFRFLRQLKRNNNRQWFDKNRERYLEHVRDPMLAFIDDFGPRLRRISRAFVADASPVGGSMFRIHRDMRFVTDGRPYKTAATAQFRHVRARDTHAPGFYLHLGEDSVFAGTGLWRPDGPTLNRIRTRIVDEPAAWKRCMGRTPKGEPLVLEGQVLKRPPRGFDPEHPLVEDLKRKDFVTLTELDETVACSPDFIDRYTEVCRARRSFVRFLTEAIGLEW